MPPKQLFAIAVAALALAACSTAPQRPENLTRDDHDGIKSYVGDLIRHEMRKNDIAGLSIALIDDQKIIWAAGFGDADRAAGRRATAETIYRVGSISKLFTAAAAMQLAEQGKLGLDRPLRDALPEFAILSRYGDAAAITPRNLMTHHSGLPRDFSKGMFTKHPESFTELLRHVQASDAAFPPNQVFSYSNIGITLLGHAIQNVGNTAFADHVQHALLDPMGMNTARFEPGIAQSELMARPYRKGTLVEEPALRDLPAGGLNASVLDLSRFLATVFAEGRSNGAQVLKPESIREMLRPQNTDVPLDFNFHNGLGWMLSTLGTSTIQGAGPVAHHAGAMLHYRSQLYALPEQKLGVVVLANSGSAGHSVDRIATEALTLALETKTGIKQPKPEKVAPAAEPWPVDKLQSFVGDYTSQVGHIRIRLDGATLRADALGRTFNLVPRSDGRLGLEYKLLGLLRIDLGTLDTVGFSLRQVAGRNVLAASIGAQDMLVGELIAPPKDIGPWRKRLGRYEIVNAGDDHTFVDRIALTEENGFLIVELVITDQMGPPQHLVLQPLSAHAAILLGTLADGGGTLRCANGVDGLEQCSIAGYALKRVAN
jgi:CubicO group peptidase (beta-lactamase class C family)